MSSDLAGSYWGNFYANRKVRIRLELRQYHYLGQNQEY